MSEVSPAADAPQVHPNIATLLAFQQQFVDGGDASIVGDLLCEDFHVARPGLASAIGALIAAGDITEPQLQSDQLGKIDALKQANGRCAPRSATGATTTTS